MTKELAQEHSVVGFGQEFESPFVDCDEQRSEPVPHRFVHGGFAGTETRFSFYFPPAEKYAGRFFQHFSPVPQSEYLALSLHGQEDQIGFAFDSGAYLVDTNGGGTSGGPGENVDPTVAGYRANAAAATFSRTIARQVYGDHRPFGYAYGGSGGAYRTFGAAENTAEVWDGFVPYVAGSPMAAPNVFTARMHAQRILRDVFDQIVDAMEPGGSGDPYAGLDEEQRAALLEVTRMGFPLRSWFGYRTMGTQAFGVLYPSIVAADPDYFRLFWTEPGYLGADPDSSVHRDRVQLTTVVRQVLYRGDSAVPPAFVELSDGPAGGVDEAFKGTAESERTIVAIRLATAPRGWVRGAELRILSGLAKGTTASLRGVDGDLAVIDFPDLAPALNRVAEGDEVSIDNSNFLAAQTYHRHQVPGPEYAAWDQFRDSDGKPRHPQRPAQLAPQFAAGAAGRAVTGNFRGHMILVESALDREAFPWQADWYRARAEEFLGTQVNDRFRVWIVDNALHGDVELQEDPTHTVSYVGVLHEALRQLVAWVEQGRPPSASTRYRIVDGQVELPDSATDRLGVQPVVHVTVDGGEVTHVATGTEVRVSAHAEVPPGAGGIVKVGWDLDGDAEFEEVDVVEATEAVTFSRTTRFDQAETYFVAVRVSAQRDGDASTSFARIDNLGRARVVVEDSHAA